MPRKSLIRSKTHPYHVTARSNNRDKFPLEIEKVWAILELRTYEITLLFDAKIHSLVLMPNHLHLLISTPQQDLGEIMKHFMQGVTKDINLKSGRSGRIFGSRYYWSLISNELYFAHAFKYVYRNPVRANLCEQVGSYPYSSIGGLIGEQSPGFPIHFPYGRNHYLGIPQDTIDCLRWLNDPTSAETVALIRKGLRRLNFKLPRDQYGFRSTLEE